MIIQADGVSWPLETFLDAYQFYRTEGEPPEIQYGRIDAVMRDGRILRAREISDLPWWEVIAMRPEDRSMAIARCDGCGCMVSVSCRTEANPGGGIMVVRSWDICGDCEHDTW